MMYVSGLWALGATFFVVVGNDTLAGALLICHALALIEYMKS